MFKDRVLFIDGEALVIDKPAGLPVDRPRDRSESLEDLLDRVPKTTSGTSDLPLAKHSTAEAGWRMVGDPAGKPARTRWELVETIGARAMLALFPETGRTHQIRVHAAEGLGLPIVGDPVYGRGGPAVMLHAQALTVPREGKPAVEAEAPLPVRFHNLGFGRG
jgi:tRNA pseudouridine32 synthase/23S rRNA pseudouridine746 synthase